MLMKYIIEQLCLIIMLTKFFKKCLTRENSFRLSVHHQLDNLQRKNEIIR